MSTISGNDLPTASQRVVTTPSGRGIGASYAWDGGQYCAIHTRRGVVGCGIFSVSCADEFRMAFALAKGTPETPLREPEDLLAARIVAVSAAARELGIQTGMTGEQALDCMLR